MQICLSKHVSQSLQLQAQWEMQGCKNVTSISGHKVQELERVGRSLERKDSHQPTMVQDEVSRPALRQTVMTTN